MINCLFDAANGCGEKAVAAGTMQDPSSVTGENYAQRMKPVIDYLKYYAPNAQITLLGYQEYTPRSGSEICVRVGGTELRKPDATNLVSYMNNLESAILKPLRFLTSSMPISVRPLQDTAAAQLNRGSTGAGYAGKRCRRHLAPISKGR